MIGYMENAIRRSVDDHAWLNAPKFFYIPLEKQDEKNKELFLNGKFKESIELSLS
jgi:hypothetical protein